MKKKSYKLFLSRVYAPEFIVGEQIKDSDATIKSVRCLFNRVYVKLSDGTKLKYICSNISIVEFEDTKKKK